MQAIILDTNVLSELVRPEPNQQVSGWYLRQEPSIVYTTAVTLAETLFGLGTMPHGRRRAILTELTHTLFDEAFQGKVLPFDEVAAVQFGRLRSESQQKGRPMGVSDTQIAAIASANGMMLATRNTMDFERCGAARQSMTCLTRKKVAMPIAKRTLLVALLLIAPLAHALDSVPKPEYRARRVALAEKLHGGVAVLFAAEEPAMEYQEYRQDEDFYYLTGWNEPGAAVVVMAASPAVAATDTAPARTAQPYREVLFLPTRNPRTELYTGAKMDAVTPSAAAMAGVDEVLPMAQMPVALNAAVADNRGRLRNVWTEEGSKAAGAVMQVLAVSLGVADAPATHDLATPVMELRAVKSPAEMALMRKASDASIAAQLAEMKAVRPGVRERTVAGVIVSKLMEEGCERVSYPAIVGSGANATTLHYSENSATMRAGDLVVIDAAGDYSMYASDITRTLPVSGKFSPRQREIYEIVLGAQRAAAAAFVAGRSKINDPNHKEPDSLDTVAFNYINAHGKDLHGEPLGKYMVHGIGHLIGIDVHDPWDYTKPLEKGMAFTIEPGIYLPEEKIGVRIEDVVYVDAGGKLVDLIAKLPHTVDEVEAAMRSK